MLMSRRAGVAPTEGRCFRPSNDGKAIYGATQRLCDTFAHQYAGFQH